jgi:hypothetical protein
MVHFTVRDMYDTSAQWEALHFISLVNAKALTRDWLCFTKRAKEAD